MDLTLLLYIFMMLLGIWVGSKKLSADKEYPWLNKLQFCALMLLIVALGIKIGADDQVVSSLKEIGVSAFVITIFAMGGSVFFLWILRRWMKLDREGVKRDE